MGRSPGLYLPIKPDGSVGQGKSQNTGYSRDGDGRKNRICKPGNQPRQSHKSGSHKNSQLGPSVKAGYVCLCNPKHCSAKSTFTAHQCCTKGRENGNDLGTDLTK